MTLEGQKAGERIVKVVNQMRAATALPIRVLTAKEARALTFIQRERALGRSCSVRSVAKAVGLRSSRSGARIVYLLITKGFVKV